MQTLSINLPQKQYSIMIKKDLLPTIAKHISMNHSNKKIAVVTDEHVDALYGNILMDSLSQQGFLVTKIVVPPGEKSKSMTMLEYLYGQFLDFKISRSDLIIAFGGGVVGDLVGFAASTFLRGVPYIQIPTTLLAQIDSSIGGKVAVNLPNGKNLIGTFYHPDAVYIDPKLLETLPIRVLRDGIAEVIKYSGISETSLFEDLSRYRDEQELLENIHSVIATCCEIKQSFVEKDEKDTGLRMTLNFGHTIGHAIENYFNYETYTHGEAVAIGMARITTRSEALGITKPGTSEALIGLIEKYGLPTTATDYNQKALLESMTLDKKNSTSGLHLILLAHIGKSLIQKVKPDEIHLYL
ncbi:3-dehydroquinate synthase [Pelosinus sp. sgz500959]|uniref:3-dehydroquinate synthase n=1 Tax=Pelosinus sp. sgz500959 TaxID=3242472 RepID=UPI00366AE3B0